MNQPTQSNSQGGRPPSKGKNNNFRNRRRYRGNNNRNRPAAQSNHGVDRLMEKYINLLDQHLIARRKFHDLYYRADDAQLNKLERNFYSTLHDLRDFEEKIPLESRQLFEQRVNGLKPDNTYSLNHNITEDEKQDTASIKIEDPHFLQSQIKADYSGDTEESMGSLEDYNKYKML